MLGDQKPSRNWSASDASRSCRSSPFRCSFHSAKRLSNQAELIAPTWKAAERRKRLLDEGCGDVATCGFGAARFALHLLALFARVEGRVLRRRFRALERENPFDVEDDVELAGVLDDALYVFDVDVAEDGVGRLNRRRGYADDLVDRRPR